MEDRTVGPAAVAQVGGIAGRKRLHNQLTEKAISSFVKRARAGKAEKRKLFDGGGLFILLTPAGNPVWRLKYRFNGAERTYAVGQYPAVGLSEARKERERIRALLLEGRDPQQQRLVSRARSVAASEGTFAVVASEWLARQEQEWSGIHYRQAKRALERDVYPTLGKLPVEEITSAMIANVIDRVVKRGARETAAKLLWNVGRVFDYAKTRGLCSDNPASAVREVLPKKRLHQQRPALLAFQPLRDVLNRIDLAPISPAVRLALRLVAFTGVRIGNAIAADWQEFSLDSDDPTWVIPREQMKVRQRRHDHKVLLSPTIANELRRWRSVSGGRGFLFPSTASNSGHVTHEALEKVLRVTLSLRGKHSVHGWRSSLSTLAREAGFSRDCVELMLDHIHDSQTVRDYDRGERLEERRRLVMWWDANLTGTDGVTVIPLTA